MHVAQRFELFLDTYRRPDGSQWTGQQLDEATDGVVTRSYVTNLRKGRIENPGYEKMLAIARAMGFPPALWFKEARPGGRARDRSPDGEGTRPAMPPAYAVPKAVASAERHIFGAARERSESPRGPRPNRNDWLTGP